MAQLAAAGRTQEEIQNVMSAALDLSASGTMSLESAVKNLNKTYAGMSGELGESIPAIKNLTKEQLKSGEAVALIAEQYKGMAETTALATGSSEQLANAWGDLKEEIGASFEKNMAPMRRFFTELISGWADVKKKKREYDETKERVDNGTGSVTDYETIIATETKSLEELKTRVNNLIELLTDKEKLQQAINESSGVYSEADYQMFLKGAQTEYELHYAKVESLKAEYDAVKKLDEAEKAKEEADKKAAEQKQKDAELAKEKADRDKEALEFMQKNQEALDKRLEQMRIEAELKDEDVDQQAVLNELMNSYIQLVTGSDLVTENNPFAQKRLEELKAYAEGMEVVVEKTTDWRTALDDLNDYLSEAQKITSDASNLFLSSIKDQTDEELTELSKQYTDGLISYEEYCKRKKEISKKAAQEEYKIKMWEWSSSLLTATANIAEGVSKAIAQGGVAGIITGALVAASGAIQIANLVANKPRPPQFANGGYVPGTSYFGDNVPIMANSGELILNSKEQAVLRQFIGNTGNSGAVVNMPVTIENNSSAHVSTQMNKNGLRVIVDEMVGASMAEGRYNEQMAIGQSKAAGVQIY